MVRSSKVKDTAKAKAAEMSPGDAYKFWFDYFVKTKFKTPAEAENTLSEVVSELVKVKKYLQAEAAIKAFMQKETHSKDAQPWMYEILVLCLDSTSANNPASKAKADQDIKQTIGFAAHLAKKTGNPTDLVRIADMMVLRGLYGTIGTPGYETSIGELIDLAADKVPSNAFPGMMSVNLAAHDKDPKRMGDAAERLLSLGWPLYDDKMRRDVKDQVKILADYLKAQGKAEDAEALLARLAESETRDVYIKLTWKGEADIDMSIAEPLGATAQYHNPRTVFGGAIIKNGFGSHPEEVYVCPRAFPGDYTITFEKIVDYDTAKPVLEATLEVILHEGEADEERKSYKINLAKPEPIVVKLAKGRRKQVLPFVAPAPQQAAPVAESPKPKADPKAATPPTAPRGAPFR